MRNTDDILTVGLGFGDEAKGSFLLYLAAEHPDIKYFEKYNGGFHGRHCIRSQGKACAFSQLSPSVLYGGITILNKNFVFEPFSLLNEIRHVAETFGLPEGEIKRHVFINNGCVCCTLAHKLFNRSQEAHYGALRRGSVGTGASIAGFYSKEGHGGCPALRAQDLQDFGKVCDALDGQMLFFQGLARDEGYQFHIDKGRVDAYKKDLKKISQCLCGIITDTDKEFHQNGSRFIYESSQGILLDKTYGLRPNTTLLDTSCDTKADVPIKIGFLRSVYTRHGPGCFPTESPVLNRALSDSSQEIGEFSGKIRFGHFDCVLCRYAIAVSGVQEIYMSHIDCLALFDEICLCTSYIYHGEEDDGFKRMFQYEKSSGRLIVRNILSSDDSISLYLHRMEPVYETIAFGREMGLFRKSEIYLKALERECGIPVTVVSVGPDVKDKQRR